MRSGSACGAAALAAVSTSNNPPEPERLLSRMVISIPSVSAKVDSRACSRAAAWLSAPGSISAGSQSTNSTGAACGVGAAGLSSESSGVSVGAGSAVSVVTGSPCCHGKSTWGSQDEQLVKASSANSKLSALRRNEYFFLERSAFFKPSFGFTISGFISPLVIPPSQSLPLRHLIQLDFLAEQLNKKFHRVFHIRIRDHLGGRMDVAAGD